jgi:hypothetical protein
VYVSAWPAGQVFGTTSDVPDVIMRGARDACARLALYALDGPLDAEVDGQVVEQTVGPITTKYAPAVNRTPTVNAQPRRRTFPDVARLMTPYLTPTNPYSVPMVRA